MPNVLAGAAPTVRSWTPSAASGASCPAEILLEARRPGVFTVTIAPRACPRTRERGQPLTANVLAEPELRGANHGRVSTSEGIVMFGRPHTPSDVLGLKAEIRR